ncbi:MAG: protein phosphatase 2C domain-containing protein [Acidimicrobiales bacterium]|nr:protein phosphatase 2C domain-containing protein [Acidimicrobiales bacterium]
MWAGLARLRWIALVIAALVVVTPLRAGALAGEGVDDPPIEGGQTVPTTVVEGTSEPVEPSVTCVPVADERSLPILVVGPPSADTKEQPEPGGEEPDLEQPELGIEEQFDTWRNSLTDDADDRVPFELVGDGKVRAPAKDDAGDWSEGALDRLRAEIQKAVGTATSTVVVSYGDEASEATRQALAEVEPQIPSTSVSAGSDGLDRAVVRSLIPSDDTVEPESLAIRSRSESEDGWPQVVVDVDRPLSRESMPTSQLIVELDDGTHLECPPGTSLPAEVTVDGGTASAFDAIATVTTDGGTRVIATTADQDARKQLDDLTADKERLERRVRELTEQQVPKSDGGGSGMGTLGLALVVILGLLAAIAYLFNRKPAPPAAPAFAFDPHATTMAPGVVGGTMAPAAPPGPDLPARYTEPAPIGPLPLPEPAPGWTGTIPGGSSVRLEDVGLMRVVAEETPAGKAWATETTAWSLLGGWSEKVAGKGEDSEPVVRVHRSGAGFLAAFDGTGGSGSAPARQLRDGTDLSGAYVASRLSREVLEAWGTERIDRGEHSFDADDLRDRLARSLQDEASYPEAPKSTMRGSLQRVLPTTMAAVGFRATADAVELDALWAGDSRAFVLTPGGGLQVLTVDDTRETDALELIRNDQPMSNLISADRPFVVNLQRYRVAAPALVLTATDGCFGYVRTPAHFEHLILDTLMRQPSVEGWTADLLAALAGLASDDTSFAMVAFGFGGHSDMQAAFRARHAFVAEKHWVPFQRSADKPADIEELRIRSWEAYQGLYHALVLGEPTT